MVELGSSQCDSVDQCKCELLTIDFFFQQHCRMETLVSSMQKSTVLQELKDKVSQLYVPLPTLEAGSTSVRTNVKNTFLKCMVSELKEADTS